MLDAVQAASFVTEKKTAELVEKVASLGGSHRAELLKENMVCFNTRKHTNEAILYSADSIEDAMKAVIQHESHHDTVRRKRSVRSNFSLLSS